MPLVFAAITPHPPLLIPAIGKEEMAKVEKTKKALATVEAELYLSKAQIIIIISPHSGLFKDSFALNAERQFQSNFEKFGDLTTKKQWSGTPELAAQLAHDSRGRDLPVQLVSEERLDHGVTVPLFYLTNNLPEIKILPVGYSGLSAMEHVRFGEMLKDRIMASAKRVAVIASGDLSHHQAENPAANKFDQTLTALLAHRSVGSIIALDDELVCDVDECGYRSILILLGVIKNLDYKFTIHAYENPFGVGYLTGSFSF